MVAAVDELDGELEELLALLRVGVQAHRPLLAELRKKEIGKRFGERVFPILRGIQYSCVANWDVAQEMEGN